MTWLFGFLPHICRTPANDPEVQKDYEKLKKFALPLNYKVFVKDRKQTTEEGAIAPKALVIL